MIWKGARAERALRRTKDRPELPLTSFDPSEVVEAMRRMRVPEVERGIPVFFGDISPLACILLDGEGGGTVLLHSILNRPETPLEVMRLIGTHELLHILVEPEEIHGKWVSHTPRFWELERSRCPEREWAWTWIYSNLGLHLRRVEADERVYVRRSWRSCLDAVVLQRVSEWP